MAYQLSDPACHRLRVPPGHSVPWGSLEFFNLQDLIAVSPEASSWDTATREIRVSDLRTLSSNAQVKFDRMSSSVRSKLTGCSFTSPEAKTLEAAMNDTRKFQQ
jgi:hypothetical protein